MRFFSLSGCDHCSGKEISLLDIMSSPSSSTPQIQSALQGREQVVLSLSEEEEEQELEEYYDLPTPNNNK
jgi:hypothetical protein